MEDLVKIGNEVVTTDDFVRTIRLKGTFTTVFEDVVDQKILAQAAQKAGITASDEEIQTQANLLRRAMGRHRAVDMMRFLEATHTSVDQFEAFVKELVLVEKQEQEVTNDAAVEEFFKLNSPKFDLVDVLHMALDGEGAAKEVHAILEEDPGQFQTLAMEHSITETRADGGALGKVTRGSLGPEIESRLFNSETNVPLGPFSNEDNATFDIFMVVGREPATLDELTRNQIKRILLEDFVAAQTKETVVEIL